MKTAGIMLVRDEADIIGHTLDWMETQVDHIYLLDNCSRDPTTIIIEGREKVTVIPDNEIAYWQSRKMTDLARRALEEGFHWVVPCDADEMWIAPDGLTLAQFFEGVSPNIQVIRAELFDFVPTNLDNLEEENPFRRLQWRLPRKARLAKVACRTDRSLVIHAGNHGAHYTTHHFAVGGLTIRHCTWRTEEQYLKKIRNGIEAYRATDLPEDVGAHWRMWDGIGEEAIREHFRKWFYYEDPELRGLVHDPLT